jgi:hypothetical protein
MGITIKGGNSSKLADLIAKLSSAKSVEIGWNSEAKYPSGHRNGGDFVANVAMINEKGGKWSEAAEGDGEEVRQIPPRPFFRTMIAKNKEHYAPDLAKALVANDFNADKALNMMGALIGAELQTTIEGWTSPGNAPRTIARKKGLDDPLVESHQMIETVNHWVK